MISKHKSLSHETNKANYYCLVCNSPLIPDSSSTCSHICFPCEITLSQCPVCIQNQSTSPDGNLDDTINNLLMAQPPITSYPNEVACNGTNPIQSKEKAFKEQVVKQCFLGIWDGILNCVLGALGIKSSRKNLIARNVHNVILRVGRQTGRALFSHNSTFISTPTSLKLAGGVTATLLCIHLLFLRNRK